MHTSGADLYFPASHDVHGPPTGPTHPDLHVHVPLVSVACMFEGHVVQNGYPPVTVHVAANPFLVPELSLVNSTCMYSSTGA